MDDDRPDFVPSWWPSDWFTRWLSKNPSRALVFYATLGGIAAGTLFCRVAFPKPFEDAGMFAVSALPAAMAALLAFCWIFGLKAYQALRPKA